MNSSNQQIGTQATHDSPQSIRIIDVNIAHLRSGGPWIVLPIFGVGILSTILAHTFRLDTTIALTVTCVVTLVPLSSYFYVIIRRGNQQKRLFADRLREKHVVSALFEAFDYDNRVPAITEPLLKAGQIGFVLRLFKHEQPGPIEPLSFPFEPHLLNEAEPATLELMRGSSKSSEVGVQESETLARLTRTMRAGSNWGLIALLLTSVCMQLFVLTGSSQRNWWQLVSILPGLCCLALLLHAQGGSRWLLGDRKWLIVPSGLLLRENHWLLNKNVVHLFRRQESNLCLQQTTEKRWTFEVADDRQQAGGAVTDQEMNLLLRAWLSPLPPPSPDQFTDFR